jgi:RHS repeat-associated protein
MDSAGTVRENNRTLPYGEPWTQAPPSLSANALKFTTYQHDDESGLEYAMARYYARSVGRFLTPDPGNRGASLDDPQSWNPYIYAAGDPINNVDPSGTNYYEVCFDGGDCFKAGDGEEISLEWVIHQANLIGITVPSMWGYWGPTEKDWIWCSSDTGRYSCGSVTYIITEEPHSFIDDIANGLGGGFSQGMASAGDAFAQAFGGIFRGAAKKTIVGKVLRYSPLNSGPLSQDVVATFRGGSYTARTLIETTTFYRVVGTNGNLTGPYWTSIKPAGPVQAIIDFALMPQWGNTAVRIIQAEVPAGTVVYEGFAAAQGGLVGGGVQVYIPKVAPAWIRW